MNDSSPLAAGPAGVALSLPPARGLTPEPSEVRAPAEESLRPGSSLKGYRLVSRLSAGSSTDIWLAKLTGAEGFEKGVALKTMLQDPARRPVLIEMLTNEAAIGGRLYHPSIVQLLDFTQADGRFFISMEYVDGVTLRQAERRLALLGRRFPLALLVHIVTQVCRGLQYAHALSDSQGPLGFIHRNITPENVILSRSGAVKLIDFGASRIRSIPGPPGTVGVELAYAAPERVKGLLEDRRCDIYSLGVILYEVLCNQAPFEGDERTLRTRIVDGRPTPPRELVSDLPEGIVRVVSTAMAPAPEQRYASAEDLANDLQSAYDTHVLGLKGVEREPFDLRSVLAQIFRDIPNLHLEAARVPFAVKSTPTTTTIRPGTLPRVTFEAEDCVPEPLPELRELSAPIEDSTEPCVMAIESPGDPPTVPIRVPTPTGTRTRIPTPTPTAPPLSLPSLSWLFERRGDERQLVAEIFQHREEQRNAPVETGGTIFDHTVREGPARAPAGATSATTIDVELPLADRSGPTSPDVFAIRRRGEEATPAALTVALATAPPPPAPTDPLEAPRGDGRRGPRHLEAVRAFDRGLAFLADKQYQLALDEWERALELDPNNRMYQTNLKRLRARLPG